MKNFLLIAILVAAVGLVLVEAKKGKDGRRGDHHGGRRGSGSGGSPNITAEVIANVTALAEGIANDTLTEALNATLQTQNVTELLAILAQVANGTYGGNEADFSNAQDIIDAINAAGVGGGGTRSGGRSGESNSNSSEEDRGNNRRGGGGRQQQQGRQRGGGGGGRSGRAGR